jgi:hypothetical protein
MIIKTSEFTQFFRHKLRVLFFKKYTNKYMSFGDDKAAGNVTNPTDSSRSFDDSSFAPAPQTTNRHDFSPSSAFKEPRISRVRLKNQEYLALKWRHNNLIY